MPEPAGITRWPLAVLYPILDAAIEEKVRLDESIRALARAGCRQVQLRAKDLGGREFYEWALLAVQAARASDIALVVNDRVDVALAVGASGVHLGQDDLSVEAARRLLGARALIGFSTHSVAQAMAAERLPVDYVAIGPVFETPTKTSGDRPLGVEGVRAVRAVVRKPLVAIGGITLARGPELLAAGADSLAVISALKEQVEGGASFEQAARSWLSLKEETT